MGLYKIFCPCWWALYSSGVCKEATLCVSNAQDGKEHNLNPKPYKTKGAGLGGLERELRALNGFRQGTKE